MTMLTSTNQISFACEPRKAALPALIAAFVLLPTAAAISRAAPPDSPAAHRKFAVQRAAHTPPRSGKQIAGHKPPIATRLSDTKLLNEVERRAFRFFWEQADPKTGLVNDRAFNETGNNKDKSDYTVASIASTGYALAALPIAAEHHWVTRQSAYNRALLTLRWFHDKMPREHGWFYHFINKRTGERVWKSELSTIDTSLLLEGVLIAGQYWKGTEVSRLANAIYDRVDWTWMRTNGGAQPGKNLVAMGWRPESSFLKNDWDHYCELMLLYLLGMGSRRDPLPAASWSDWKRNEVSYGGRTTLAGGPIFLHQMAQAFYNFKGQRDALGYNYSVSAEQGTLINRQYCLDKAQEKGRKTYGPDIWGLNACDGPDGYKAYEAPGDEDGTVSPTGALAAILVTPRLAMRAGNAMYARYGDRIWGRYGFSDSFNVDRNWYDKDVIGIDLGMVLLALEDARTGLPWKLLVSHPATQRGWKAARFQKTTDNTRLRVPIAQ